MPVKLMRRIQVSSRRRLEYFQSRNWRSGAERNAELRTTTTTGIRSAVRPGAGLTDQSVPQVPVSLM